MTDKKEIEIIIPIKAGMGHCGPCHLRGDKYCLAFNKKLEWNKPEADDKEPMSIFLRLSECYVGEIRAQKRYRRV